MGLYDKQVLPLLYSASATIPGRLYERQLERVTSSIDMSISTVYILISSGDYLLVVFGEVWTHPELLFDAKDMASLGHFPGRGGHMDLSNKGRTCCSPLSDRVDLAAPVSGGPPGVASFAFKQGRSTNHFNNRSIMIRLVGPRVRGGNRPLWEKRMLRSAGKLCCIYVYEYDVRPATVCAGFQEN